MATKRPRYMISVDDAMFKEIEDFRFEKRFSTRSEATAELIRLGLEAIKKEKKLDLQIATPATPPDSSSAACQQVATEDTSVALSIEAELAAYRCELEAEQKGTTSYPTAEENGA